MGFLPDPVQLLVAHLAGLFDVVVAIVRIGILRQLVMSRFVQDRTPAGFGGHPSNGLGIGLEAFHLQ